MGSVWEFLYQTLTVSLVAAVLLIVKRLMRDKLSPRWQYGVWAVLAALARYAFRYAKLRSLLRRGRPAGDAARAAIEAAAEKYALAPCRAVAVPGLESAFVCGVFRPVLAVPEGAPPDEKVVLHELLHLKYHDAAQNVFWSAMRALHWCNPFMQYVFNTVGNDMESLCDQRAPGTSSISNGARNVARRIEAIARFRLYPDGMALAGVCAALVLGASLLTGPAAVYAADGYPRSRAEADAALVFGLVMVIWTLISLFGLRKDLRLAGEGSGRSEDAPQE